MTEPEANEADLQEQLEPAVPPAPELADEVVPPPDDVPEADAIEQQLSAVPGTADGLRSADPEADEADVLEQQTGVPDWEDLPG
ncbi:MAG: uncharacterized protein JWN19_3489 [Arthrobacter sp.]|nr:uncharacterized protein [Arthrobacter sp.]